MKVRDRKSPFYTLDEIMKLDALYNLIYGERSNGKTFSVQELGLKKFFNEDYTQTAVVRRWTDDAKGVAADTYWNNMSAGGKGNLVEQYSGGEWEYIWYYRGAWWIARDCPVSGKRETIKTPLAYRFILSTSTHLKSSSYPNVGMMLFDEFIDPDARYLPKEFEKFQNLVSTIVRVKGDVKIFMLGNCNGIPATCIYIREMGLKNVKRQQKGTIDLYTYGDSDLTVAVEYSDFIGKKESDKYFAFDNPKLRMITGGGWEIGVHPHAPVDVSTIWQDAKFSYYVEFDDELLRCDVFVDNDGYPFIYVHPQKRPDDDFLKEQLLYSPRVVTRPNWRRNILHPMLPVESKIVQLHKDERVFFKDNETGELYTAFLDWCKGGCVF